MASAMGKLFSIMLMVGLFGIFGTYYVGVLSSHDTAINVTNTSYEAPYQSNTEIQTATMSLFSPIGLMLGVSALLIAIVFLGKMGR